jgi:hypothetical protein
MTKSGMVEFILFKLILLRTVLIDKKLWNFWLCNAPIFASKDKQLLIKYCLSSHETFVFVKRILQV